MRPLASVAIALLVAASAAATEPPAAPEKPDYTREKLRSIFLEATEEGEEARMDPAKAGIPLFSFQLGGSKTTVRFLPFPALLPGATGLELNPVPNPFDLTGVAGSAISGRSRNRYTEWWISRKLGFPLSPPKGER